MSLLDTRVAAIGALATIIEKTGGVEGRVRLQKTVYLLKELGVPALRDLGFRYHHYGPYSSMTASALQQAVALSIVEERTESFDEDWQRFEYKPGRHIDEGSSYLDARSKTLVEEHLSSLTGAHWRTLELAATVRFLQAERGLARDTAIDRALKLKPACRPFMEPAMSLLDRLSL